MWLSAEALPSGWGAEVLLCGWMSPEACAQLPEGRPQFPGHAASSQPVPAAVRQLSPSKPAGGALPPPDPLLKELADNLHFE